MGLLIYTWNELTHKNLCMFVISTQRRWLAVYLLWLLQRWIDTMQTQRKHFKEDRRSATWNKNGTVNKVRRSSLCECVETTEHVGTWNDVIVMGSECVRELDNLMCTCYWFTKFIIGIVHWFQQERFVFMMSDNVDKSQTLSTRESYTALKSPL